MKNHIKNLVFGFIFAGFSAAFAGSFDDFFIAIRNDNVSKLQDLLQRGFDPNIRDEKGQPGLTIAMLERSPKVAKVLLEQPTLDLNALNRLGESALMIAAIKGDLASVKRLTERGASINQPGWSALHYAASGPDVKTLQWLIDQGADLNALSPNGSTPLMLAAQYGTEESVDLLLARGADMTLRNQLNLGAIDFARRSGRDYLVQKLEAFHR